MNMDVLQLLFFAGLAVFLGVRLYMLLGKPSGRTHEDHVREERERAAAAARAPRPVDPAAPAAPGAPSQPASFTGPAAAGLAAIAGADGGFDQGGFVSGAREAYKMIVEAYAAGDKDALAPLLSEKVMAAWGAAIDARAGKNWTMTTEIDRLKRADIVEASLNDNRARVKVAFSADIASETRDADGAIMEGDLTTLKTVDEIWSFERDVTSPNPNWYLAGVRAA
ncbi:MAG: Tim44/TimA family putative adaptor protein [Alphaproteobacteria bacterium]|nr:Tim44/TimA family putative adaptor protein [Alphaproteobacteria bacterium]